MVRHLIHHITIAGGNQSAILDFTQLRCPTTPQLHRKMCLAGISRHAHKICGSCPLRVRHLALIWLILRCLTHDKEKKYSSCPKNVIPLAQSWSGTYVRKMLHAQEQIRQPYCLCRISWGVLVSMFIWWRPQVSEYFQNGCLTFSLEWSVRVFNHLAQIVFEAYFFSWNLRILSLWYVSEDFKNGLL